MSDRLDVFGRSREGPRDDDASAAPVVGPSRAWLAKELRAGRAPSDRYFDRIFPDDLRLASSMYFTPLCVALRVAAWLDELECRSLVDVGSGAGKLCVATALAGRFACVGLEQRPRLVQVARSLAREFSLEGRVRFIEGTLETTPLPDAEAYYLYNPFGENLYDPRGRLDDAVELSDERYRRDVALTEQILSRAPVGTLVLTYNGFGGVMPRSYREVRVDHEMPNVLRLFRKTRG